MVTKKSFFYLNSISSNRQVVNIKEETNIKDIFIFQVLCTFIKSLISLCKFRAKFQFFIDRKLSNFSTSHFFLVIKSLANDVPF